MIFGFSLQVLYSSDEGNACMLYEININEPLDKLLLYFCSWYPFSSRQWFLSLHTIVLTDVASSCIASSL